MPGRDASHPQARPFPAPAQPPGSWHPPLQRDSTGTRGHAETVRARYLVDGRKQVWQADTPKRAPVQRRGPHVARRRRSREQVNRTPEAEIGDGVAGMLRSGGTWGATRASPPIQQHHQDHSIQRGPVHHRELVPGEPRPVEGRRQGGPGLILALLLTSSATANTLPCGSGLN